MKPIAAKTEVEHYQALAREMTLADARRGYDFDDEWVRRHDWKVVPVEDASHFAPEQIADVVTALRAAGYCECVAVATEPLDPAPTCYWLSVSEEDLQNFNKEWGAFRFLLTDADRNWAISCNEWFNLFAGPSGLLEAMLGKSIEDAREVFLEYASLLASGQHPDESSLKAAHHYASL
jgi:hypothetical protein